MDEINYAVGKLLEPVGGKPRVFLIDYRDDKNSYFNKLMTALPLPGLACNVAALTDKFIQTLETEGYTVYSIMELLDGFTKADPTELHKHVVQIYLDLRKERFEPK